MSLDDPVRLKDLRRCKVCMVYVEDEEANLENVGPKDHLSHMDNIAGVHLATEDKTEIIVITPVLELVDEHAAVARLNFRRCKRTMGDCE